MNRMNSQKSNCNNCSEKEKFYFGPIRAVDFSSILSPSPNVPTGAIIPEIYRYFYVVKEEINLTNGVTLSANLFIDDNGNSVTVFNIFKPNGYANLYINAVMQQGGFYTLTPFSLTILPDHSTISQGMPIIIESIGFTIQSV